MTRISSSCTKGDQQIPEEIFDMAEDMFAYGLPENANDADIIAYAHYCLEQYEKNGWKSGDLSEVFADDFKMFDEQMFEKLSTTTKRRLRNFLRKNGVYVPKGRSTNLSQALVEVVENELPWLMTMMSAQHPTGDHR